MTPGSPGLMGVLLIVIGLALALLAVAIVLNRRDARTEAREPPEQPDESAAGEPESATEIEPPAAEPQQQPELPAEVGPGGQEPQQPTVQSEELSGQPAATQPASDPRRRALLPIAELLREEVTGELILRLGDRYFRSPGEIENEADRRRLQYASADLSGWFEGADLPARRGKRRASARREQEPPGELGPPEGPAAEGAEIPRPRSMIEAINAILDRKLAESEGATRAVRLVADPSGGVRVLIGVRSYPLEEVPDESVKQFIREAVGEWEASQ